MKITSWKGSGRGPQISFLEFCKEIGLTMSELSGHFSTSNIPPPKPSTRTESKAAVSQKNKYYDPKEIRLWWKLHNEANTK